MLPLILRRRLATIPVMGVVALFVFALLRLTPGDPAAIIAGDYAIRHLILPALTLSLVFMALIARMTRASMLSVLGEDYIRTAFAKGLAPWSVLTRHALKSASLPIVTIIGVGFALLIGGAVVTESVFALPGIGQLSVDAILRRDYPVIQGVILVVSGVYVILNLFVDLLYLLLDPRILIRYILPALVAPLIVQGTYICASAILVEAYLSVLAVGTPPHIPSWGNIMAEGRSYVQLAFWIILFPGLFLALAVLAINMIGDGLRDLLKVR